MSDSQPAEAVVSAQDLDVWLGGRQVLRGVSFSIGAGQLVGLIGPNGAGKTTLLRAILGLQPHASGELRVGASGKGGAAVGYVPQTLVLDPDLPVRARDVVALGLDGQRLGMALPSRRRRQRVEETLASVGALELADARMGYLSGGQQQRVLIAHALVARPPLLLLDEPLANLDLRSVDEIVRVVSGISREQGIAVLVSAHDMNPLLGAMDRIIYLAEGRAASGSVAEIVVPEVLSDLYGYHVDVLRIGERILVVTGAGQGLAVAAEGGHHPQVVGPVGT